LTDRNKTLGVAVWKKGTTLSDRTRRFEAATLPHLHAAYNLARWMLRDNHNAQDVVQEAYLRALMFFESFHGGDAKPWVLGIVRNTCYTWLKENGRPGEQIEFDEERDSGAGDLTSNRLDNNPEELLIQKLTRARIDAAIEGLPLVFREVIVLRELEELSYEEIAQVAAIPLGTVMSRLARGRKMLRAALGRAGEE
jgi:RNA polymerase sigma-70 factor (ECF subfamily)